MGFAALAVRASRVHQEKIMDDRDILSAIRNRLRELVGKERFDVWFGVNTDLAIAGEALVVSVPSQFFKDWLRRHFRKDLETASSIVLNRPTAIEFCIDPSLADGPSGVEEPKCESRPSDSATGNGHDGRRRARPRAEASLSRKLLELDEFVVGNSNCLAHKAAQMAAERPGAYSPLLIHGPTGTGKTHLLEGVCAAFRARRPGAATVYLSAEQFTTNFLEALHGSGLPSFRRKHRGLELLVIDGLQFFANKRATLVELVHTIDTLLRAGRQLVFAADRSPAAMRSLGDELYTRLSGGMICRLEAPEYSTRLGIVRNTAARLGITLPVDVAAFIASNFTTQSRELQGALNRLHAASLAHNRPISLALAEEVLSELIDCQGRIVKLSDIDRAVCNVCGLDSQSLQSNCKAKTVSHPRMLAMWLARKYTRAALSEIGTYFGRRSHSTVISAQKKIEGWMASGTVPWNDRSLSLEETIRRVEEHLRAG
jgi:chromosomal replication initiator protein